MKKTLHIGDSDSWEGCMKFSIYGLAPRDSYDIMGFDYPFCTACLPRNLSKDELTRCISGSHNYLYKDLILRFADIDLKAYDKIVIWHTYDSNSLLLLYFFSSIVEDNLYHCIIEASDDTKWTGGSTPGSLRNGFRKIKMLSDEERASFKEIYLSLLGTEGIPKIEEEGKVICKSKEFVKSLLLKHLTKTPKPYNRIVGETIREFPREYRFDPMYLDCLILEMIEDGTLKPLRIIRDNSKRPYPIGGFYNRKYLYKGEDMGGWYNFSVVKNEKQM